ncbi:MAG: endonuclease domain-containing protein [Candidatus Peribacteraceae bacterium]|nr:endonuclease domain-containing protein [Candidatus Peribacteraceae bacterium]
MKRRIGRPMNEEIREKLERKRKCAFVKRLRRHMTLAEKILWKMLRTRRCGELKFRRQVNIGIYIVDFLCKKHRLIVEVDGGIHERKDQKAYDHERDGFLRGCGYRVLRIRNAEVRNDLPAVLRRIGTAAKDLGSEKQHTGTTPLS